MGGIVRDHGKVPNEITDLGPGFIPCRGVFDHVFRDSVNRDHHREEDSLLDVKRLTFNDPPV
jgi:hypothetical protein